jgi:hypothetical protein
MNFTESEMTLKTRFDNGGAASAATAHIALWEDGLVTVDVDWTNYFGVGVSIEDLYFESMPSEGEIVNAVLDEMERLSDLRDASVAD